jgi:hypothetical protein
MPETYVESVLLGCLVDRCRTVARAIRRSSTPNFRSTTNLMACRERNMITNVIMKSHDAIVIAVDLLSGVIGVARTANDVEGIHILKERC